MPGAIPILLMARELNLGGSERQLAEIAKSLDRRLFDPRVGCLRPGGLRARNLESAGVPVINFSVSSLADPSGAWRIGRYIREESIRLVHTFDTPANLYAVPAARLAGTPVVLSSQRVDRAIWPAVQRHALRITDRMVDGVVVNCDFLRRHLVEDEKVPAQLIHLCYNGVDTRLFHPRLSTRPEVIREAGLVIGVVCSLRPEKGLDTLLDAFAAVRPSLRAIKLVIIGSGPCLPDLQQRAQVLGISKDCLFEPATADVPGWLRAIDIFVLPSVSEALSNALMEAMACGCCVAASRVGGNPELVTDHETGMLFQARDVRGLAEVLRLLAADKALRERLAARAVHLIEARFALPAAARKMADIYSMLLPQHQGHIRRAESKA